MKALGRTLEKEKRFSFIISTQNVNKLNFFKTLGRLEELKNVLNDRMDRTSLLYKKSDGKTAIICETGNISLTSIIVDEKKRQDYSDVGSQCAEHCATKLLGGKV